MILGTQAGPVGIEANGASLLSGPCHPVSGYAYRPGWCNRPSVPIGQPFIAQFRPHGPENRLIHRQHEYCQSTNLRFTRQIRPAPRKVIAPLVLPGMKQPDHSPGDGISACDIGAFSLVAMHAGQSQVFQVGLAPVLTGDDVVNVKATEIPG